MKKGRVLVAMSGGVDSSAALALLKDEGYECVGVSMQLWDYSRKDAEAGGSREGSCCSMDDVHDARAVADKLGVPFYVLNMEGIFSREVVDYFVRGYMEGRTPNPCIKCNQMLKFDALIRKAAALDAGYIATGHYARITSENGVERLLKGVDPEKDQSYFLFTLTRGQMKRVLFPVGRLTKKEVREYARGLGLRTSEKKESQEICFVEDGDYAGFLLKRASSRGGAIVDEQGKLLGAHRGLVHYTIGQRKGLNLQGGPFYVTGMDTTGNTLTVGPEERLYSETLTAGELNWIDTDARLSFEKGALLAGITSKIRYRHAGEESTVEKTPDGKALVTFSRAQKAVTPGQAVVFYMGDEVLGGGWIEGASRKIEPEKAGHD